MEIIKKIGGKEEDIEYIPKVVVDRRLDGLRRLRQVQHNEVEKEKLKEEIADFNRERTANHSCSSGTSPYRTNTNLDVLSSLVLGVLFPFS